MKRFIVALIAGAAVFTLAFGAAAALSVNGEVIQAGSTNDLVCDSDGIVVDGWGLETDAPARVYWVRFAGIDTNCDGANMFINVTSGGVEITEGGPVVLSGTTAQVNFDTPVDPAAITDLEVFIEG
jgi:hypothetical protein